MSALTLDLPADVLAQVQAAAQADGDTSAEWVARAVEQRLWLLLPPRERPARKKAPCRQCDARTKDIRRGLCGACARRGRRERQADTARPERACVACHAVRAIHGRGLCNTCYNRAFRQARYFCPRCRSYQADHVGGFCSACYQQERRATQRAAERLAG